MSELKFSSNRAPFNSKNESFKDMVMGHMAMDIEAFLKLDSRMPVSNTKESGNKRGGGGHMKAEARHFINPNGKGFRVEINKSYAAYQERGARADGSHRVQHYSTPGTGAGFFKRSVDAIWKNRIGYLNEARKALNL